MPRALFGTVNIVREIAFLQRTPSYSANCSVCWSINLRLSHAKLGAFLDISPNTATVGDARMNALVHLWFWMTILF
jgi:hypothetical protein